MADEEAIDARLNVGRQSASALYGLIIACAVLATASPDDRLLFVALTVIATLTIYWIAETYVHLMATRQAQHHELSRAQFAAIAKDGLPLITVMFAPVIALLLAFGHRMSRDAGMHGVRLVISTLVAGLMGLAMVRLKIFLNH